MAGRIRKAGTDEQKAQLASPPGMELSDFTSENATRQLYVTVSGITFG